MSTIARPSPDGIVTDDQRYRAARVGLASLSLASFGALTTEMLPVGLLPQIASSLGVAQERAGLLVGVYAVMVGVLAVPLTIGTRRLPRKPLLLATLLGYAVSNVLAATTTGFAMLATARAIGGVTHALFFSISIGYAAALAPRSHTGKAMALMSVGGSAGFVLGVPLGTVVGNAVGWRAAFGLLTVLLLAITAVAWRVLPGVPIQPPAPRSAHRAVRPLVIVTVACALAFLGHYTAYTYVAALLTGAGLPGDWVGPALLVFGVTGLVGLRIGSRFIDGAPLSTTRVVPGLLGAGLLLAAIGYPALVPVVLGAVLWTGAFGAMPSLFQALAIRTGASTADLAGAWVNSSANVGIAGGAVLGGAVLAGAGVGWLPVVSALLMVGVGLLTWWAPTAFRGSPDPH